jgi:hypothetical protein
MAHVDRKPKAGGTTRYTSEVASGFDLIRETEVDRDFDDLYGEFNGGIDDTNIRDGASIDYAKLDLAGRLQGSDFDPTPTTPLPPGAFPTGGIPVSALPPNSIGLDQLVNGVCAPARAEHQVGLPEQAQNGTTPLNNYLSVAVTSVTGTIRVSGHVQGTAAASGNVDIYVIVRFRVGANPARETRRYFHSVDADYYPWSVPFIFYDTIPANTATTIAVDIYQPGPNYMFQSIAAGALVVETWN